MDLQSKIRSSLSIAFRLLQGLYRRTKSIREAFVPVSFVLAPCLAVATQLNLATMPLFYSDATKPNIFFLTDDSGSMDWALVTSEADGLINLGVCTNSGSSYTLQYYYTHPAPGTSATASAPATNAYTYVLASEEELSGRGYASPYGGVWRAWNKDYNKLYYNPDVRYTPWEGVSSTGALYSNAPATAAPYNPYRPSHGTINLTSTTSYSTDFCPSGAAFSGSFTVSNFYPARYYTWTDTDNDGVVDANDGHTLYEIRSSGCTNRNGIVATCPTSFTRSSDRTDCTVSGSSATCTVTQELQNFANWFSYYRKRDLTAKNAVSKVVASSTDRMGYATLHNNGGASNISVLAMNESVSNGNKRALLDGIFKTIPSGGTPLRTQFDKVGKYFECVSGNIFSFSASSPGSATCPILSATSGGACQQNFTILMTDGYWNDSFSGLGNKDGDGNTAYDTIAYQDSYSNTLGDIAMHYYERDLAPGLSDQVSVIAGVDNNPTQHMVTYSVAFGVAGNLSASPTSPNVSFNWPSVSANTSTTIDDLRHAAYNGRGEFMTAQSPESLAAALLDAFTGISGRSGTAAAVGVNSRTLNTTTRVYQTSFTTGEWSGDLRAVSINVSDGTVGSQIWSAKDQLEAQDWDTGRAILARNSSRGIPFRWTTSGLNALTTSQQSALHDNPATTSVDNDGEGQARLEYLRGNDAHEGTGNNYRVRTGDFKLGDLVNSAPIYVGIPPSLPSLEATAHSTFRANYLTRRNMIYVGGNDGMLHGFDEATGQEKIAYVPSMVFSNLSQLTYTAYSHRYYVDGTPTYSDAYAKFPNPSSEGCASVACWRTVLASGLASGGKGLFALDITDPDGTDITGLAFNETNAANIVLWEFTDSSTPNDMGYIYGQPTIYRVRNGNNVTSWAVITGNGYNSANERAVLYVLDIKDGSIIRKIDLSDGATGTSNGLSTVAVTDIDSDYIADYVYAGDLRGNLWKIDLTSETVSQWGSSYSGSGSPAPLFQARDASNNVQPITVRPQVSAHPAGQSGYMVYFGTGRYIEDNDNVPSATPVQTFYGIWDRAYTGSGVPVTRADLLPQTITVATSGSVTVRQLTNTTIQWRTGNSGTCQSDGSGTCLGWRDDLLTANTSYLGEMSVTNPLLVSGTVPRVVFTTTVPTSDVCGYGGSSWFMAVSPVNGGRLGISIFDIDDDGAVDYIGGSTPISGISVGTGIVPEPVLIRDTGNGRDIYITPDSSGGLGTVSTTGSGARAARQSWRQLK